MNLQSFGLFKVNVPPIYTSEEMFEIFESLPTPLTQIVLHEEGHFPVASIVVAKEGSLLGVYDA